MIWDLKDFEPDDNLSFRFIPAEDYVKYRINESLLGAIGSDNKCKGLRILRNALYAWFGYPFKSADLKQHFEKQWWYKADPGFDFQKLSDLDRKALLESVKLIKAEEKAQGCQ